MTEQSMINVIDTIAQKLAVPTTEILNAYTASGITLFVSWCVLLIFGLICIIFAFVSYMIESKKNFSNYENSFISFLFGMSFMLITALSSGKIILWITNPKAYAITEFIKHLK